MPDWPIWSLLHTVFGSILEVFLLCIAGYVLARKGILDKQTQRQINRLNVSLCTPSLLFSKVAFFLSPSRLRELWIIPIVFVVTTSVSMIVAYVFGSILRLKPSQRNFAMAAAMFMNSNSLPIALMQSLVYTVKELRWGDDDEKNAMLGRALTYLVLYSTLGMMLRWSYGVHLLSRADDEVVPEPASDEPAQDPSERTALITPDSLRSTRYTSDRSTEQPVLVFTRSRASSSTSLAANRHFVPGSLRPNTAHPYHEVPLAQDPHLAHKFYLSFPNTPVETRSDDSSEEEPLEELPGGNGSHLRRRSIFLRFLRKLNQFMTVPMWAALASLIVACVRPLQHALEDHMRPIKATLTAAGNCSIPLTLIILGAYFYTPAGPEGKCSNIIRTNNQRRSLKTRLSNQSLVQSVRMIFDLRGSGGNEGTYGDSQSREDVGSRRGETKTVVVAVLSRMVLTPLILLPLLVGLIASDAQSVFDDPVFVVSNVLLITSAPALTLAQITQAASGDAFERLISRTIFWAYCVVTPPSTIISVVIGLLLSKL